MLPEHRGQPDACAHCIKNLSEKMTSVVGRHRSSSPARVANSAHHFGGAMALYCDPLHCMHRSSSGAHSACRAESPRRRCSSNRRWYEYAEMCRRSSQRGTSITRTRSVCFDAIFASSSRSKRDAIAKTRTGAVSRNAGATSNARSRSITDVISYFAAVHIRGTSASKVGTSGSGTG